MWKGQWYALAYWTHCRSLRVSKRTSCQARMSSWTESLSSVEQLYTTRRWSFHKRSECFSQRFTKSLSATLSFRSTWTRQRYGGIVAERRCRTLLAKRFKKVELRNRVSNLSSACTSGSEVSRSESAVDCLQQAERLTASRVCVRGEEGATLSRRQAHSPPPR